MADLIKVNTNRLNSDQKEIGDHIRAMQRLVSDLRSHNSALDSMWDGPSSDAFKAAFESDIAALEEILKALSGINKYEDNARSKYDACEQKVGELIDQIKIR